MWGLGATVPPLKLPGLSGSPEPSEQPRTSEWQEGVSSGRQMPCLWTLGSSHQQPRSSLNPGEVSQSKVPRQSEAEALDLQMN